MLIPTADSSAHAVPFDPPEPLPALDQRRNPLVRLDRKLSGTFFFLFLQIIIFEVCGVQSCVEVFEVWESAVFVSA